MVPAAVRVVRGLDFVCLRLGWRYTLLKRLMRSAPQGTPA